MTGMPACLGGALLEPEIHFSFLKINLFPPHPSFQAGSINKGGRKEQCSQLELLEGTVIIFNNNYDRIALLHPPRLNHP